ncbi:phosphoadenylyl-sulfate reductase [Aquamicrobium sp. LC103]|uniref:phosphoadenylyl-sulfate reductase n=1 Tax=Aquamicrobium sp. LC103 TaxID=1120658 RepID=UPI00063EBE3B|nr:phosphoadenylyl-sulfate reductase [Aquamicrobium sp. LC103]TKT82673.1 phosphoadenylyl-sulfate reductase [Aquamicrobium sp. LC103]
MEARQKPRDAGRETFEEAAFLETRFGRLAPQEIIALSAERFAEGGIATVSSFGADSAVLLHMVAAIDPKLPVLFLDTGKHFGETLDYRDRLVDDLGLVDVRIVTPLPEALDRDDPDGRLHLSDTEACCAIRKVEPMARAVAPFHAWFTGRKRFQASTRKVMPVFEAVGERVRVNPLAQWTTEDLAAYMREHALRENPLVAFGYFSIGCFPCTQPTKPGEDPRAGRWAGQAKTECGIHLTGLEKSLTPSSL